MARLLLLLTLGMAGTTAAVQQVSPAPPVANADARLPDARQLLLDVDRNEKAAEAAQNDYTYHVHLEEQDLDGKGNVKKTTVTDSESITIDGVRVDRVVARNGKPLTDDEARKESERVDKAVAKAKERREKRENQAKDTDSNGDTVITASRILELGTFSNPRREMDDGRPTIVLDYAGDPNAKTRNQFEGVIRDLVGTVWVDEQDRVLVRGQGHFLNDFKIAGGLLVDIHKGMSFDFRTAKVNQEVWLPATVDAQGNARILVFAHINGRIHLTASDYRKFRTSTTLIPSNRVIGPDGQPVAQPPGSPSTSPQPQP